MPKKPALSDEAREFFRQHGAAGGKAGGSMAWDGLSKEERSARAKKAVAARKWRAVDPDKPADKKPAKRKRKA